MLSISAFIISFVSMTSATSTYEGSNPFINLIAAIPFAVLYMLADSRWYRIAAWSLLTVTLLLAAVSFLQWGITIPTGILMCALLVLMCGVLLSASSAFWAVGVVTLVAGAVVYANRTAVITVDRSWVGDAGGYVDAAIMGVILAVIALVSWLSNREIERSLARARTSEAALLEERNSLEVKVAERAKEIERLQVEKMLELHRFAEFGRLSAGLLHELANPLTAMSLNLSQIQSRRHRELIEQTQEAANRMQGYLAAARRQLRSESAHRRFDASEEVERIVEMLKPKALGANVDLRLTEETGLYLYGDAIKFNHLIGNLVANAIDAYDKSRKQEKQVNVTLSHTGEDVEIVVEDFGVGIPQADIDRVFDPFFTTKAVMRGTGIGLAIARSAVEDDFSGTIRVESNKKHTVFIVRLPVSRHVGRESAKQ